ncbi:hypothetical protein D187_006833 [Cystobacter fuscus DSM 2262]|uniref:Uncharacterized protein n=1 Tax=Cystobacter fuscus (strain ATCC 25194 / DSM 2262 / NBRC 100088 / M29) TaxID=1242864 RepID=S9Q6Y4_CYSF2|nr:hypothetical protein D187_006833 [Cystobacter fuscus DSM 2262]
MGRACHVSPASHLPFPSSFLAAAPGATLASLQRASTPSKNERSLSTHPSSRHCAHSPEALRGSSASWEERTSRARRGAPRLLPPARSSGHRIWSESCGRELSACSRAGSRNAPSCRHQ